MLEWVVACNLNTNLFFSRMHQLFRGGPQEWRNILVVTMRDIEERRDRTKKTRKKRRRQSGKQNLAETYEPPSRSHRRRVSYPLARAHENTTRPRWESSSASQTPRRRLVKHPKNFESRPGASRNSYNHGLRERLLHDSATLLAADRLFLQRHGQYSERFCIFFFLFTSSHQRRADWKCLNNVFLLHVVLMSRKRESPVCDRKYHPLVYLKQPESVNPLWSRWIAPTTSHRLIYLFSMPIVFSHIKHLTRL